LLFIFGGLYTKYGELIYPDPRLAILSPVRSMYVYQLFLGLLFCNFVINKFKNNEMKFVYLSAPFFVSYGPKGIVLYLLVLLISIFFKKFEIIKSFNYLLFVTSIIFILILNSSVNRVKLMDFHTFKKLNHWSTHTLGNQSYKDYLINLRTCEDFLMLDDINLNRSANYFSNKSKYYKRDSVALGSNYDALVETRRRQEIINLIKKKDTKLTSEQLNKIKNENFLFLTKLDLSKNFYQIDKNFGNMVFIFDKKNQKKIINECKVL